MRYSIFWMLVLVCFIISIILFAVYDGLLAKQGLDKYARAQKEVPTIFFTGFPLAIGYNIYFKLKYRKK